jgi:ferritin-like metal-binding protein YciE
VRQALADVAKQGHVRDARRRIKADWFFLIQLSTYWPEFIPGWIDIAPASKSLSITKEINMPINNPKELFVKMLSDVRQRTEQATKIYEELGESAQDPTIKEALQSRAFLQDKVLSSLDRCFKLIGEKPVQISGRLQDVFIEDFRRELAEIQAPAAKALFVLVKANHLVHWRIAEYMALIAMADISGHFGVGVLLESCLADKLAFVERTRRLIRRTIESEHAIRLRA